MGNRLYTSTGEEHVIDKGQIAVTDPRERMALIHMHEVAQKYGLAIVCLRCDKSLHGENTNAPGTVPTVQCGCREWRFLR